MRSATLLTTLRSAVSALRGRATAHPRHTVWKASLADLRRSQWHQHPHP
jgi:hypothetical protein